MNKLSIILLNAFPDKKIKSLGNKCLLNIKKNNNLFDYNYSNYNDTFTKFELIVVGGFDYKRLNKYLIQKYKKDYSKEKIQHIYHEISDYCNIGKSISKAINASSGTSYLIINNSMIINKKTLNSINFGESSVFINKNQIGNIGCVIQDNVAVHFYYGLANRVYDMIYISNNDKKRFDDIINHNNIDRLFMFELMNLCINNNICLKPIFIKNSMISNIEDLIKLKEYHE